MAEMLKLAGEFAKVISAGAVLIAATVWLCHRWRGRLHVKSISDPNDPDLDAALELYKRRIDESVCCFTEDIRRWVLETQTGETANTAHPWCKCLYVAKYRGKVCAFFYGDFHRPSSLLLISYLVSEEVHGREGTRAIMRAVHRDVLRCHCAALLFEMEEPDAGKRDKRAARLRDFQGMLKSYDVRIAKLNIPFVHPKLSLWDKGFTEKPQFLYYARVTPPEIEGPLPKSIVSHLLDVYYNEWYGSSYDDDPDGQGKDYRAYVRNIYESTLSSLPEQVAVDFEKHFSPPAIR